MQVGSAQLAAVVLIAAHDLHLLCDYFQFMMDLTLTI